MKKRRERDRGIERERKKKVIILSDPRIKKFSNIKSLAKRGHDTGAHFEDIGLHVHSSPSASWT